MIKNIKNICTCPKCGHSVGWRRKLFTGILAQWPCKNCGTALDLASIDTQYCFLWLSYQSIYGLRLM